MNDIINKRKETKLKKYGSKNFVNSEKAKQTKLKNIMIKHLIIEPKHIKLC